MNPRALAPTKSSTPLPILTDLAIRAVVRVGTGSELQELYADAKPLDREQWREALADLKRRLEKPIAESPKVRKVRIRTNPGDVFQLKLTDDAYAYGRLTQNKAFCIYSKVTRLPNNPPIGSRRYIFYHTGIDRNIRDGVLPIVGRDPWDEFEPERDPRFYSGDFPWLRLCNGVGACVIENPTLADCFGLERFTIYDYSTTIDRILEGELGPTARRAWPLLPDDTEKLRPAPWSEWRKENEKIRSYILVDHLVAHCERARDEFQFFKEFEAQRDRQLELLRLGIK